MKDPKDKRLRIFFTVYFAHELPGVPIFVEGTVNVCIHVLFSMADSILHALWVIKSGLCFSVS